MRQRGAARDALEPHSTAVASRKMREAMGEAAVDAPEQGAACGEEQRASKMRQLAEAIDALEPHNTAVASRKMREADVQLRELQARTGAMDAAVNVCVCMYRWMDG